jgi:pyrophosphatase PpaX
MKYSSVIFDWDGTLGMTLHLWLDGYRNELEKLGFHYSDKVIVDDFFYEHVKAKVKYPDIDFKTFVPPVYKYVNSHISSLKIYPGVHDALERLLKNDINLTLVSSSEKNLLTESLIQADILKFFSVIVSGDDVKKHKPDPEPFEQIIEIAKISPKDSIVLGDSHTDILAAKAAGLDSCLFLPFENKIFYDFTKLMESNPTYSVENLKDFADLILKT